MKYVQHKKKFTQKLKPFPSKKYRIIYADPPWSYRNMGNIQATAASHYKTMSQEEIKSLPVYKIAKGNSILFLWATFPKIQ